MDKQWENFLKNQGKWHGSFTKFSNQGIEISDVPSILALEAFNNNSKARIDLRRFYPQADPNKVPISKSLIQEFQPPLPPDLFFCDNGSFCRGIIQIYPSSTPTIEFGLLDENKRSLEAACKARSRQVQKYNWNGNLEYITLIREVNYEFKPEKKQLQIEDLLGTWQGNAIAVDRRLNVNSYEIKTQLERAENKIIKTTIVDEKKDIQTGNIFGSIIDFASEQILLLQDGAWASFPNPIKLGRAFEFQAGWLFAKNSMQRLKRCYNEKGEWASTILITESRT